MTKLFLGVDGGGSGCRAVIADQQGKVLGSSIGGPANIMTDFDSARENIMQVAAAALRDTELCDTALGDVERSNGERAAYIELSNIASVIGVAGANVGDNAKRLADSLPFHSCQIENDSTIAVRGALGSDDGIVAAIGTGSIFIIQTNGEAYTIGGWGNVIGDQASGVWLGKRLLHDTLLCFDGIYAESPLYSQTMTQFDHSPESIVTFAKDATPTQFASFAKTIMDYAANDDSMAKRIVQHAVSDIELILDKISDSSDLPLCLLGSLGIRYTDHLSDHFQSKLREPYGDAVAGAVAIAIERWR